MKRLDTVQWAAEVLNVSPQRIYEMVRVGILPPGVAIRLGRQVRIDAEGLTTWAAGGGQALPGGWRRGGGVMGDPDSSLNSEIPTDADGVHGTEGSPATAVQCAVDDLERSLDALRQLAPLLN